MDLILGQLEQYKIPWEKNALIAGLIIAGLTLTERRNRAGVDLIEALEQLNSWYKVKEYELEDPVATK
jgi:hypothetical protein